MRDKNRPILVGLQTYGEDYRDNAS